MKEARFIELLNLYLDQQITPEEAADLEAEIARSPAHRRTYNQYCRMHRACTVLFDNATVHAPAFEPLKQALQRADDRLLVFPSHYFNLPRAAWVGAMFVAACAAFVVFVHRPVEKKNAALVAKDVVPQPAAQVNVPTELFASVATTAAHDSQFHPVFIVNRSAPRNGSIPDEQNAAFDWIRQIQLSPLSNASGEFVLEAQPTTQPFDMNFRHVRRPVQGAVEMTAFEFQK